MSSGWTDEKIEELKNLWAEGLTTCEIGKALNVSKNAVVGKAHRLGLESRPSPIKHVTEKPKQHKDESKKSKKTVGNTSSVKEKTKKEKVQEKVQPEIAKKQVVKAAKKKVVKIEDLTINSCRWPIGDPKEDDFHFCGKEVFNGKPYCLEHCAAAYVGINKKG